LAFGTIGKIVCESTWVVPVGEASSLMVGCATESDNQTPDDEDGHDGDFGDAQPELQLAEMANMDNLEGVMVR
jgi:hypothetical protein